jgi:hypothetical protein
VDPILRIAPSVGYWVWLGSFALLTLGAVDARAGGAARG